MAPESIENDIYTEATDVVSLCNERVSRTLNLKAVVWLLVYNLPFQHPLSFYEMSSYL